VGGHLKWDFHDFYYYFLMDENFIEKWFLIDSFDG
jgi:hypothetical protein